MVNVTAEVREIDGEFWVYVVSDGPLVGDDGEPLLPDYELVS